MPKLGPVKISYMSCVGCKHSRVRLTRDGEPEYEYFCNHDNWPGIEGDNWGKFSGWDEKTPEWCPELPDVKA